MSHLLKDPLIRIPIETDQPAGAGLARRAACGPPSDEPEGYSYVYYSLYLLVEYNNIIIPLLRYLQCL